MLERQQKNSVGKLQNSPNVMVVGQAESEQFQSMQPSNLRQGISPTPKLPIDKKKKPTFKYNEKFDQLWQALKNDVAETADFSNGDLQEEGLQLLTEYLKNSKKIRSLKLVRNKLNDDSACLLLDAVWHNQSKVMQSIHMQSNMLTEKTLDHFIHLTKQSPHQASLPKNLYMNSNLINASKNRKKIEDLRKNGYIVTI